MPTLNICKQVPAGTQAKQEKLLLNHVTTTKSFTSKWRRIHDQRKANRKLNTIEEIPPPTEPEPEIEPLRSILKNRRKSKDAYYHTLSEAEFDQKVIENTEANKVNKPSIKTILKKHDNLKTILKQAQQLEEAKGDTQQMPNHKETNDGESKKTDQADESKINLKTEDKGGTCTFREEEKEEVGRFL